MNNYLYNLLLYFSMSKTIKIPPEIDIDEKLKKIQDDAEKIFGVKIRKADAIRIMVYKTDNSTIKLTTDQLLRILKGGKKWIRKEILQV